MRDRLAFSLVAVALVAGSAGGYAARDGLETPGPSNGEARRSASPDAATPSRSEHEGGLQGAGGDGSRASDVAALQRSLLGNARDASEHEPEQERGDALEREPRASDNDAETEQDLEIRRLQAELDDLRSERLELLGSPIEAPATSSPRFTGGAISSAIRDAMGSEAVPGDIEATDCAEHPCIVFGRLDGDEEDMEKIERSPSLSPYADDVLTLLFWAATVEEGIDSRAQETGLFALAFYSAEEREGRGEELDRRIRARVMEYWNTDRPGARG
jgi:hypothetical protein